MKIVSRMRRRLRTTGVLLVLALGTLACDAGESGPGELEVEVSSVIPLSAAVVEFAGPGITGARVPGGGRLAGVSVGGTPSTGYRVVVFRDTPGPVRFALEVDDVGRTVTGVVLDAADGDGQPVSGAGGLEVSISR